jgi:hypothetical protein
VTTSSGTKQASGAGRPLVAPTKGRPPWTDDKSNLSRALRLLGR